jgi:hypothetical protein
MNKQGVLLWMAIVALTSAGNVYAQDADAMGSGTLNGDGEGSLTLDLGDGTAPGDEVPGVGGLLEPVTDYLGDTVENVSMQVNDTVDLVGDLLGGLGGLGGGGLLGGLL